MSSRLQSNIRSIVSIRELGEAVESEKRAGRYTVERILLRILRSELYRYNWNYRLDDLPDLENYLRLTGEEEPELWQILPDDSEAEE